MVKMTLFRRFMTLFFSIIAIRFFLIAGKTFAQEQEPPIQNEMIKPKIIFDNQSSDSAIVPKPGDGAKIIFKKSYLVKKDALRLISSTQFEMYGQEKMIGDKGQFLIEAMKNDQRAIDRVHQAYRKKESGDLLMVLAGVGFVVGMLTIPTVDIGETQSGNTVTTYYWLPPVTIAAVLGGIGYARHSSLEKSLDDAIKTYNDNMVEPVSNEISQ
jgi:hypothetical protein